jgi:hypothetical protein
VFRVYDLTVTHIYDVLEKQRADTNACFRALETVRMMLCSLDLFQLRPAVDPLTHRISINDIVLIPQRLLSFFQLIRLQHWRVRRFAKQKQLTVDLIDHVLMARAAVNMVYVFASCTLSASYDSCR